MNSRRARPIIATLSALALAASTLVPGIALAAGEAPDQPASPSFAFQKIADPADVTFTQLLGINDHRLIAGYHTNTPGNKGFTLKLPDNFTDENFPNSAQTQVVGINNEDQTVGFYIDQAGTNHGFEKSGALTTVDLPGTTFNQLLGINNKGQAAGYYQDAAGLQHGYVHEKDGSFLVLNIPMPSDQATSINDHGDVVGFMQSSPAATTSDGWLLHDGELKKIDFPRSTFTQALGINNSGDIVGDYNDANGVMHGFEYRDGNFRSIDVPGASATTVNGINNQGWIVGFFQDPNQNNNTIGLVGNPRGQTVNDDDK
jgi:probable HAF family extracellular repeat protein